MHDVQIIVNGKDFQVNYKLLSAIAEEFPAESQYAELGHALIELGIDSITEKLLFNMAYDRELCDSLWEKGDLRLRRLLLDDMDFLENLTDAQAQQAIDSNDVEICGALARNCEKLYYPARRISADLADSILEALAYNEHAEVRRSFLHNQDLPEKFIPDFAQLVTENLIEPDSRAIARMTMRDLNLLPSLNGNILLTLAENVEEIENSKVKRSVALYLATHPDPAVRLELAANPNAPGEAFEILLADSEPDVVAEAYDSLYEGDEDDEED